MKNTNCINCGAPPVPKAERCNHCGTAVFFRKNPFTYLKIKTFRVKALYPFFLFSGLAGLIYVYGITFDSFSETKLVQITPLWFFPIVFGLYGYFAEFLMNKVVTGSETNISEAYHNWIRRFLGLHMLLGLFAVIILLPFNVLKFRNSFLVAFTGSVIWGILLIIFFNLIFPAL